jgi:hypothetical protein
MPTALVLFFDAVMQAQTHYKICCMQQIEHAAAWHACIARHTNQLQGNKTQMQLTLSTQHYALRELLAGLQDQATTWASQAVERQSHGISETHLAASGVIWL